MHWVFQSDNPHGNVVFNFHHNPIDNLVAFAEGYHKAGKRLVGTFATSAGYRDSDGYPVFFLYRHALELYMKAIVFRGAQLLHLLNKEKPDTQKLFKEHRLSKLLPGVKTVLDGVWSTTWETNTPGISDFEDFSKLVKGIEEMDPESYNFRYPINTKGQAALNRHTVVNVIGFSQHMDPILELLDGTVTGLDHEFDAAADVKFELQRFIDQFSKQSNSDDQ